MGSASLLDYGGVYTGFPFCLPHVVGTRDSQILWLTQHDWRRCSAQAAALTGSHAVSLCPDMCGACASSAGAQHIRGSMGEDRQRGAEWL